MKFLVVDTECGGIGLDKSLLSASFILVDKDLKIDYTTVLNLYLKPNDGVYHCTAQGMGVNNINLVNHDKGAVNYKQGGTALYKFLYTYTSGGENKLTVVGKGIKGDLDQIFDKLISRETWNQFCSYEVLDIGSVWQYLTVKGHIKPIHSTSLVQMAITLGVSAEAPHTAYGDALTTLNIFRKLIEMNLDI